MSASEHRPRHVDAADVDAISRIWHAGWRRSGTVVSTIDTPHGVFEVDVWRYEKELLRAQASE